MTRIGERLSGEKTHFDSANEAPFVLEIDAGGDRDQLGQPALQRQFQLFEFGPEGGVSLWQYRGDALMRGRRGRRRLRPRGVYRGGLCH